MDVEVGRRCQFTAVYAGSADSNYVLLKDVRCGDGVLFRDHVWVDRTYALDRLPEGCSIAFDARIVQYQTKTMGIYVTDSGMRVRIIGEKHVQTGLKNLEKIEICEGVQNEIAG